MWPRRAELGHTVPGHAVQHEGVPVQRCNGFIGEVLESQTTFLPGPLDCEVCDSWWDTEEVLGVLVSSPGKCLRTPVQGSPFPLQIFLQASWLDSQL